MHSLCLSVKCLFSDKDACPSDARLRRACTDGQGTPTCNIKTRLIAKHRCPRYYAVSCSRLCRFVPISQLQYLVLLRHWNFHFQICGPNAGCSEGAGCTFRFTNGCFTASCMAGSEAGSNMSRRHYCDLSSASVLSAFRPARLLLSGYFPLARDFSLYLFSLIVSPLCPYSTYIVMKVTVLFFMLTREQRVTVMTLIKD